MAAVELKFQGTFTNSDYLKEFSCVGCQHYLTEQDILKDNYRLYVSDYANEVEKGEYASAYSQQKLTVYNLTFWLKAIEHQECPEEGD